MSNMYTMEYYSDIKKKEILRQMDGRLGHHVKLNNSDSERSIQYDLSYTWISLLKKKKTQTLKYREQICHCQRWGRVKWVKTVERYKLST